MTLYFNAQNLCKSFGSKVLFKDLSFSLFQKERAGLIGPNGAGKSTLLKILKGLDSADSGNVFFKKGLTIGYTPQSCEFANENPLEILVKELAAAPVSLEEKEHLARMWLCKVGFKEIPSNANLLSGGWKKRLSIAQAMIHFPDLLLLDEPTNHLDLEGILWLENFLSKEVPTFLMCSHDRRFLHNTVNRIIEINSIFPEGIFSIEGTFSYYLDKKNAFLAGEYQRERSLSSKARREEEWLQQNAKARTTKARGRIDGAEEILKDLDDLQKRNQQKKATISFTSTERETRKLLVAKNLAKKMGEKTLFQNVDFTLSPGTRLGLLGPNGSGKTTLLRMLAEEIHPDTGTIKKAEGVKIVYFDQHRVQVPLDISLRQALSPNGDFVYFQGRPIHVNGWCKRFLFSPDCLDMPVGTLSGGERARISLAHLMLQTADILLLDEPANDLDIPTLEAFEENLSEFPGSIVLITHDREMLIRLCNAFLPLGANNPAEIYADYGQWETSFKARENQDEIPKEKKVKPEKPAHRLSYKEKKELEGMEERILQKEEEVKRLNEELGKESLTSHKLQELCQLLHRAEEEVKSLYFRWEELELKNKKD